MKYYRGDIVFVQGRRKTKGNEQNGYRPAVIVSNDLNNKHSNVVEVVYLTTQNKNPLPTHVNVMCVEPSTALCEQISSISKEKIESFYKSCTTKEMFEIDKALKVSLGIIDSKVRVRQ